MSSTERKARQFEPDDTEGLIREVLRYPYLDWTPPSENYPHLKVQALSGNAGTLDFVAKGVLGSGSYGVVFYVVDGNGNPFAVKVPTMGWDAAKTGTDVASRIAQECDLDASLGQKTFSERLRQERDKILAGLSDDKVVERLRTFKLESRSLERLNHPNVVKLVAAGELADPSAADTEPGKAFALPCIVMEFLDASRLSKVIDEGKIWNIRQGLPQIVEFARDVALALNSIHDRNACHRDLSWGNILVTKKNSPVIIDLGNVALADSPLEELVKFNSTGGLETPKIVCTPGFAAPEVQAGGMVIDGRADQFSLGVILYLWFAGKSRGDIRWPFHPQSGKAMNSPDARIAKSLDSLLRRKIDDWPDASKKAIESISAVVARMLAWDRDDRYPSLRDAAAEFEIILVDLQAKGRPELPDEELSMESALARHCRELYVEPDAAAATMFHIAMVRQARILLEIYFAKVWDENYFILTDSKLDASARLTKLRSRERQVEEELVRGIEGVRRTYSETRLGMSPAPRFGGRVQTLLERIIESFPDLTMTPETAISRRLATTSSSSNEGILAQLDQLWNLISERQRALADIDFELAVYLLQLGRLRNRFA